MLLAIGPGPGSEITVPQIRSVAGQSPVVDGPHEDAEELSEFLDPDERLQPQFRRTHAQ